MAAAAMAAKLDNGASPEVAALAKRARAELVARKRREAARFGGLFSSQRYAAAAEESLGRVESLAAADRRRVATAARQPRLRSADARSALSAWLESGAAALEPAVADGASASPSAALSPRAALMRLVRRAALEGGLEDGDLRKTLREHGLAPALFADGDPSAEGVEGPRDSLAAEADALRRVRGVLHRARDLQALSEEELEAVAEFREREIARLQALARTGGAGQEQEALLARLCEQRDAERSAAQRAAKAAGEAAQALARLQSDVHIGPRERYNTLQLLEAERARLEALEADAGGPGLRSEEAGSLRQLRGYFEQRGARDRMRAEQQQLLAKMQQGDQAGAKTAVK